MFGDAYFGPRYYADRYFGDGTGEPEPPGGGGDRPAHWGGLGVQHYMRLLIVTAAGLWL